jgi:hypothetical protein
MTPRVARTRPGCGVALGELYKPILEGGNGTTWRAIDLYKGDALDKAAFIALIRSAVAQNAKRAEEKAGSH